MKNNILSITLLALICLFCGIKLSFATTPEQAKRDAEVFARGLLISEEDLKNNIKPEEVPGYNENPEETKYYNNPSKIESDSLSKKETDENSKLVETSFEKKKAFKEEALKVMAESQYIKKNPKSTIEAIEEEYIKCESKVIEKGEDYEIKRCDEYKNQTGDCSVGSILNLDNNTNYTCTKTKDYYNKKITQNRNVSCASRQTRFFETTYQNFQGFKVSGNKLYLGVNHNNLGWNCGGYWWKWNFKIDNLRDVEKFILRKANYDDKVFIYVNNKIAYQHSGGGCEKGRVYSKNLNINLKPYLRKGTNELKVKLVVGGTGRFYSEIEWGHKTCTRFNDSWSSNIAREVSIFDDSKEEQCSQVSPEECLLNGTFTTSDGYTKSGCRKKETAYKCTQNQFTDYCKTLSKVEACSKFSSKCKIKDANGHCEETQEKYTCGNLDYYNLKKNDLLINYPYSVSFGDTSTNKICTSSSNQSHCDLISNKTGEKSCYLGSSKSDCSEYEQDSSCSLRDERCFNDACTYKEKVFHCSLNDGEFSSEALMCADQKYCLDESCASASSYEKGTSLPKVLTYLKSLEQIGKDSEKESFDINIFTGKTNKCEKDVFGAKNCCKDSGWGLDVGLSSCSYEEKNLGLQKQQKVCKYIGSYCSDKEKLTGTCLKKAQSYCCFNSKLSRIIQEQGKSLLGLNFGSPQNPQCRGFTVEELQSLDFTKIDFTEYTEEISLDMQVISQDSLDGKIVTEIEGYENN